MKSSKRIPGARSAAASPKGGKPGRATIQPSDQPNQSPGNDRAALERRIAEQAKLLTESRGELEAAVEQWQRTTRTLSLLDSTVGSLETRIAQADGLAGQYGTEKAELSAELDELRTQSHAEMARLHSELEAAAAAAAALQAERAQLQDKLTEAERLIGQSDAEKVQLAGELAARRAELDEAHTQRQAELDRLQSALEATTNAAGALRAEHAQLEEKLGSADRLISQSNDEKTKLSGELSARRSELDELRAQSLAEAARLQSERDAALNAAAALQAEHAQDLARLAENERLIGRSDAERERLTEEVAARRFEIDALRAQALADSGRVQAALEAATAAGTALLAERAQLQDRFTELDAERTQSRIELRRLQSELEAATDAAAAAQTERTQLRQRLQTVESDALLKQEEWQQSKKHGVALQKEVDAGEHERQRLAAQRDASQRELTLSQKRLATVERSLRESQTELQRLIGDVSHYRKLAADRVSEGGRLTAEIENTRRDAELAEGALAEAQSRLARHERSLQGVSAELRQARQELAESSDDVSQLQKDIVVQQRLSYERQRELHTLRSDLQELRVHNTELRKNAFRHERRLQRFLNSPVSRAIAPLHRWVQRMSAGRALETLRDSGLVDGGFYRRANPDVARDWADPAQHYVELGADELRDPNPLFDTAWYTQQNPDVAESGANPLLHFITTGARDGRDPSPLFQTRWYLEQNPDVAAAGSNPLRHYLEHGAAEKRAPNPLFDTEWYLRQNPQIAEDGINPLAHYQRTGAAQGSDPHPLFDTSWYLEQNPELEESEENPLAHYLRRGALEGRSPHPLFDGGWYIEKNPDVAASRDNPLLHYLVHGGKEGRNPSPNFDNGRYLAEHPEVARAQVNPLLHHVRALARDGHGGEHPDGAASAMTGRAAPKLAPNAPTLCIVDPNLKDFLGHHYEYDHSTAVAARARGFRPIVLSLLALDEQIVHDPFLHPTFRIDMWGASPNHPPWSDEDVLYCNRMFYDDLIKGLRGIPMRSDTIIFCHMITGRQLLGWAWFAEKFLKKNGPKLILLLRYDTNLYEGKRCEEAFRILEQAARRGSLRLASDSARLARQLEKLTTLPVEEFAIPHTTGAQSAASAVRLRERGQGLRFVSLGNGRDEKGIFEIFEAIQLHRSQGHREHEFVIQCNDARPDVQRAVERFARLRLPGVRLVRTALGTEEYYQLLQSADVVLVPYWRSIYQARTSGIFVEAVAAGKVVICTEDTWMSDELQIAGAGVLCRDRNAPNLLRAIADVAINFPQLHEQAIATRESYVGRHNAQRLIGHLERGTKLAADPHRRPRIAVFYPWGDIFDRNAGASVRVNLMLDFLEDRGADIRVFTVGDRSGRRSAHVLVDEPYQGFDEPPKHFGWLGALSRAVSGTTGGVYYAWYHWAALRDRKFHARVEQFAGWADVALLEYTFWAKPILAACRRQGIRQIITDHDVISDNVKSWILRWPTRYLEFHSMKRADAAVTVAPADQKRFLKAGIKTTLIPNPASTADLERASLLNELDLLNELFGISSAAEICLFVGSGFDPNRIAAAKIHDVAKKMRSEFPQSKALFVVAGNCAKPERDENYLALGSIEKSALVMLYERARMVMIPLHVGTGSSVKTIEALAAGKVVVGTGVAFRGLDVVSGKHCIIEDEFDRYPQLVDAMLSDAAQAAAISDQAKIFGAAYDYRTLYPEYLPLLELPRLEGAATAAARPLAIPLPEARMLLQRALDWNKHEAGLRIAELALRQYPDDGELMFLMGRLWAGRPDPDVKAAERCFKQAIAYGYDEFKARLAYSALLQSAGDTGSAEREETTALNGLIESDRADPQLLKLRERAWNLFFEGNREIVQKLCKAAIARLEQRQADIFYLLAHASEETAANFESLLQIYQQAIDLGFEEFWPRYHRARVYIKFGRPKMAEPELARALVLKPDDLDARELLSVLRAAPD